MKVFHSNDFSGMWPVGASAVVVATDEGEATELLSSKLKEHGLAFNGTLIELDLGEPHAVILQDGNY